MKKQILTFSAIICLTINANAQNSNANANAKWGISYIKVQYNNLLNPSQSGDSLIISIGSPKYQAPGQSFPFGGGVLRITVLWM